MKNNTIIGFLLTFFMLLLVLSAAVVFLYQDRRQLLSQVDDLQLNATVVAVQAQQTVADMSVQNAGVAAAATASHNNLVQTQATRDALSARVATLEAVATPTAAPTATDGTFLPANEPLDVVAFVAHPAGIEAVELLVDDEPRTLTPSEGAYRVISPESPLSLEPGNHTITVLITGSDNQSSSAAVSFTVNAPPAQEEQGEEGEDGEDGS